MPKTDIVTTELTNLVNRNSLENGSNTPDFILGEALAGFLNVLDRTIKERDRCCGLFVGPAMLHGTPVPPPPVSNECVDEGCEPFQIKPMSSEEFSKLLDAQGKAFQEVLDDQKLRALGEAVAKQDETIRQLQAANQQVRNELHIALDERDKLRISLKESEAGCSGMRKTLISLRDGGGFLESTFNRINEALQPNSGKVILDRYEQVISELKRDLTMARDKSQAAYNEIYDKFQNSENRAGAAEDELANARSILARVGNAIAFKYPEPTPAKEARKEANPS